MNIFVPVLFLVSLTLAEPPVGDGYPTSRSNDHHHGNDHDHEHHPGHQRSLSEEYGPPSSSRNAISDVYSTNSRTQHERQSASSRTSNQRNDPASARSSANSHNHSAATRNFNYHPESTITHGYAYTRSGSSQKNSSFGRSLSERHGIPEVSARTLSTEYGMPDVRSTPSEEYGVPIMARQTKPVSFRTSKASRDNSRPVSRSSSTESHSHNSPTSRSNTQGYERNASPKSAFASEPSQTYGAPEESFNVSSRSLSTSDHQSQGLQGSGASSQHSEVNGASARGLSQEYDVPSSRANYDEASSYAPSRSSPSSSYPAARSTMPSQEYGVPEQNQGYEDARSRALNELLNQEPASYDFAYQIEDQESGVDFGHTETREENRAQGSYFVVLPDGTKQTVEYEADERGFKPRISVEPAAAGYDDNAQDLARSAGGPY